MKKSYNTLISNTRFSSGVSIEKKLKIFATIILIICVLLMIAAQGFGQVT